MADDASQQRVTFRHLLRIRSFFSFFVAEIQSIIGDQIARFALSVLVFDRTGSATFAALTYAVSFLPAIAGGILLGSLGDRYPQRRVMIGADLFRGALFVLMAVPGLSVGVIVTILAVAVFVGPAFSSAEVTYLATMLRQEEFRTATALRSASNQLAQVVGFAVGGVAVLAFHPRGALLIDAGTFLLSAGLVATGVRATARPTSAGRHAADPGQHGDGRPDEQAPVRPSPHASTRPSAHAAVDGAEFAGLWRERRTRSFMILTLLTGLFVVPEGLVVPFGERIGASVAQSGVLVSMIPLGSAVGAALVVRARSAVRHRVAAWMAFGCGLPLLVTAADPAWPIACLCWFASGVLAAYQVEAITALVHAIPERHRSRLVGIIGAWLLGAQGGGFSFGGLVAHSTGPGPAIAAAAGLGSAIALVAVYLMRPVHRRTDQRIGLVV